MPVLLSGLFVLLVLVIALVAPLLPVKDPASQSVVRRLKPPSADHVLGTDRLGRDILSRVVWGARVSLAVGAAVVAISAVAGTVVGLTSGYFRGPASDLLVRAVDVLQAFPALILALAIVTAPARKQGCCSASDAADARRVADALDIPFHALNFADAFGRIKDYFADEYLAAAAKGMEASQLAEFEQAVRSLYKQMVRISIEPQWARFYDFGAGRMPGFLQRLVNGG